MEVDILKDKRFERMSLLLQRIVSESKIAEKELDRIILTNKFQANHF